MLYPICIAPERYRCQLEDWNKKKKKLFCHLIAGIVSKDSRNKLGVKGRSQIASREMTRTSIFLTTSLGKGNCSKDGLGSTDSLSV